MIIEKLIIIGGSAGSLEVIMEILPRLKAGFHHPVFLVLHNKTSNDQVLVELLSAKTPLKVKEADEKESIKQGTVYIVPGDYHVLFEFDGTISLDHSEKVNFSRPSIDVVFQSAANIFGPGLVCILLSGANTDGTEGCRAVKEKKGVTIAQAPHTATVGFMPQHAITNGVIDHIFDKNEMTGFLNEL